MPPLAIAQSSGPALGVRVSRQDLSAACCSPVSPSRSRMDRWRKPGVDRRKRRSPDVPCAGSQGPMRALVELPLFPIPVVLFPGAILPLQIFEYRYRILMQTLLQTDLRFGILYSGKDDNGTAAAVGCVGKVVKHERLADDRYFVICSGEERFRVVDIVRSRPYLVGRVEWLEDRPPGKPKETEDLAATVERLMKDVIRLSNKMSGRLESENPVDLRKATDPGPFSFWVASTFEGAPAEQQALLELESTAERLAREKDTLRNTLNYLTAATAVKEVFSGGPPAASSEP